MMMRKSKISSEQIERAEMEIMERRKEIAFFMTEYNIQLITQKMEKREFVIPDYQREFTWKNDRKSRFIESLIMGLPIPFLFFWETDCGTLEIVDGSQRLRTIHQYITNDLKLTKLESLPSLTGTTFRDLTQARQLKVLNISIRGVVLNEQADAQVRFDMFDRINTGSYSANAAEVRRGALPGPFQDLVEELAESPLFNELAPHSPKAINERGRDEIIARFFAYSDGLEKYKDSPAKFLFDYTKHMNEKMQENQSLCDQYKRRFDHMLTFVRDHFPNGFRKQKSSNSTPRVRFEAIAIGVDHALQKDPSISLHRNIDVSWLDSETFELLTTSDAANVKKGIESRFNYVEKMILGQ